MARRTTHDKLDEVSKESTITSTRLADYMASQTAATARIENMLNRVLPIVERHENCLYGIQGAEPGVVSKVNCLEHEFTKTKLGVAIGLISGLLALLSLVVGWVLTFLKPSL